MLTIFLSEKAEADFASDCNQKNTRILVILANLTMTPPRNSALAAEVLNFSTFVSFTMRWSYCQRGLLPQAIMQIFGEMLCEICRCLVICYWLFRWKKGIRDFSYLLLA